jgi:pyruvate-formate lyase
MRNYAGLGENYLPEWLDVNRQAELMLNFHKAYTSTDDIVMREVACLKAQYPLLACAWQKGDKFAGRKTYPPLCFSPQTSADEYAYNFSEESFNDFLENEELSETNREALRKIIPFWQQENTMRKAEKSYPPELWEALTHKAFFSNPGVAFPLYRLAGAQMDLDKLVRLGVEGLRKEIEGKMKINKDAEAQNLYKGMLATLDVFGQTALHYASMIERQKQSVTDPADRKDMDRIIASLKKIATKKPGTFHEALQLAYLYCSISGALNYGRMDEYLGDIYAADLKAGRIKKEDAEDCLMSLFGIMEALKQVWDQRTIVGGKGRRNETNADEMALVIMDAVNKYRGIVPQLTLRFYKGQNPELYKKALDIISTGYPFPLLYNDDVNIPSVMASFGLPEEEAMHYLPYGCGEYIINHRSFGTPSGLINMLAALNITLNNGIEPLTGEPLGLALGDPASFKTFDQLMTAYKKQIEYFVKYSAVQEWLEYKIAGEEVAMLYYSMLFDDCIARGKPLFAGGIRYLGGTLEAYGNTNTADALAAIKKVVYEDKAFTLTQLAEMLNKNFEGYSHERNLLLRAPKFGNDDDYADAIRVEIDRHICEYTRSQAAPNNMHSYLIVVINNNANTDLGLHTSASADGRLSRTFMANANAPTGGADRNGVTAVFNSILKPDTYIHAGAVQNMAFSKEIFAENRQQVEALLDGYWAGGGAQIMLNVVGRGDLENAMKEPEKYANLIVRVGGFCARFVDLPRPTQLEILSRTLY